MQNSHYFMPTQIYMGDECVTGNKDAFALGKKAIVVTYDMPQGIRHYAREDVEANLNALGIEYIVNTGVKEDPPVSSIDAIRKEAEAFRADFVIAIGGGSAMDTAKAVCALIDQKGETLDILFSETPVQDAKPLIAIPTTCGTGAEVTPWIAVTRDDIIYKGPTKQKIFPQIAFVDAKYISELPPAITRATLLDALAHASESYVNIKSNPFYRACGEEAMKLFGKCRKSLLTNQFSKEDRENMILCSCLAGIAMTESGSSLPHGCSYALSLNKHMPHGLAVAATLVPYFKSFKDRTTVDKILAWCQFSDMDEFEQYMRDVIGDDLAKYEVSAEEIEAWSDDMAKQEARFAVHPEPAGRELIVEMYQWAFAS